MICSYWAHHMRYHCDIVSHADSTDNDGVDGLVYYDGWNATFWYLLNVEWYRMQDKQFAYTGCTERYEELRDFDPDYLAKHYPI